MLSTAGGEVDVDFYASKLKISGADISLGLEALVAEGKLRREPRKQCTACRALNALSGTECWNCDEALPGDAPVVNAFLRDPDPRRRDPAAVFLIHGMNTLGSWQQALAWKVELLYGYSVPVFVFKYGRDLTSPLTKRAQRKRKVQLSAAIRQAQSDLVAAGRSKRCDVIAHSFGTLLFSQLIDDPRCSKLIFGRVILTGSIVPTAFEWGHALADGRIEAVLNHRGGRDCWVMLAPWIFPQVGSSGRLGFDKVAEVQDHVSPMWGHSAFFDAPHFDGVIRAIWTPFLEGASSSGMASIYPERQQRWIERKLGHRRYWLGRTLLCCIIVALVPLVLLLLQSTGKGAAILLMKLGI